MDTHPCRTRGLHVTPYLGTGGNMAVSTIYTHFHFKANHLRDLQNTAEDKPIRVEVVKVIALTQAQYQHFFSHLLEDMPFISAKKLPRPRFISK